MRKNCLVFVLGAALLALLGALPALAELGPTASSATTVSVTAGKPKEFRFTLSPKSVKRGAVTFRVSNKGALPHDFKIAGKKTKLLNKGKSATLAVTFKKAGRYPFLCTVPGHAAAGMKGVLAVT